MNSLSLPKMKKILSILFIATAALSESSYGQTPIFKEDFETTNVGTLPTGWTQQTADTPEWVVNVGPVMLNGSSYYKIPQHTQYALVSDWTAPNALNNPNTLVTPSIALTSTAYTFLSFDYFFLGASGLNGAEEAYVMVSTDNGITWFNLAKLESDDEGGWSHKKIPLSSVGNNLTSLTIGFRYVDKNDHLIGLGIDNVEIFFSEESGWDDPSNPPPDGGGSGGSGGAIGAHGSGKTAPKDNRNNLGNRQSSLLSNTTENTTVKYVLQDIKIFPNPASDVTTVSFMLNTASKIQLQVTDISGRTILNVPEQLMEAGKHNMPVSTTGLPAGQYTVRLISDKEVLNQVITISK